MPLPNIFAKETTDAVIERIGHLKPDTKPQWGKMDAGQMLAHCNVAYEMVYEDIHPKPNAFLKLIIKLLVKNKVTGEAPFAKNSRTAPAFIITGDKDFEAEKNRLVDHLRKTQQLGESHFAGKESHSFGALSKTEWNNMFYKHLDHHLKQFGA